FPVHLHLRRASAPPVLGHEVTRASSQRKIHMNKLLITFSSLLISTTASANLKIVTTATDFADIARQIGGDKVEVHSVMKGPEHIHKVIPKPTEMVYLNQADLFANSGLDAEPWLDNLLSGARNPKVERNH